MEEKISVGKILGPHGINGEVRVLPLTDFPRRFKKNTEVWIDSLQRTVLIESVRRHSQFLLMKFSGFPERNDVEKLKNSLLQVDRSKAFKLPPGHYYRFEIIGLEVFNLNGESLGEIRDILETGANDIYAVKREHRNDLLIPALKTVVKEIDIPNRRMVVELPSGLED